METSVLGLTRRIANGLLASSFFMTCAALAAELPPEIQADRYVIQAERQIEGGDFKTAVETFDRIIELQVDHGLEVPPEFWFKHAEVSLQAELHDRTVESATRYLQVAGQAGQYYSEALRLLDEAQQILDLEQEMEAKRLADEARQREAEAQRQEAEARRRTVEKQRQEAEKRRRETQLAAEAQRLEAERQQKLEVERRDRQAYERFREQLLAERDRFVGAFADLLASGGHGPEMVVIPSGRFYMGCRKGKDSFALGDERRYCPKAETPSHRVRVNSFALSRYEVTFAEWDACVAANGCRGYRPKDDGWGRGRQPAINVSWEDAVAYAAWLSRETRQPYRLPSEAEWEYAARAGTNAKWHFGDNGAQMCTYANHRDASTDFNRLRNTSCSDGVGRQTAPSGTFVPNAFGLYDMHGNVGEWTQDCWNADYVGAPKDGTAWLQGDCTRRVWRGGTWSFPLNDLRSANRLHSPLGNRDNGLGFRVARTIAP